MIIPSRKLMASLRKCIPTVLMICCWSIAVFATNGQLENTPPADTQLTDEVQLVSTVSIPEATQVENEQPVVQIDPPQFLAISMNLRPQEFDIYASISAEDKSETVEQVVFNPITSIDIATIINDQIENLENETEETTEEDSEEEIDSTQPTSDGFVYLEKIPLSKDLQRYTYDICIEKDLRYTLILAIMKRESGFQINAIGYNKDGTTDSGLMQLNDSTRPFLRERGITNYMDPYENIRGGTTLIRYLFDKYDERAAMMAYQYGEAGMASKYRQGIYTSQAIEKLYRFEAEIILLMTEASSNTSSHTGV